MLDSRVHTIDTAAVATAVSGARGLWRSPWGVTLPLDNSIQKRNLDSPIQALFQGELESSLTCLTCGYTSVNREEYLHLSVPIADRGPFDPLTFDEVLTSFTADEFLTGAERWRCEKCNDRVDAVKRTRLLRIPPVFVVHLARLAYSPEDRAIRKLRTQIGFPDCFATGLDFTKYTLSESAASTSGSPRERPELLYDIVSIVNHHGLAAFCGHYTAHCLHCVDDSWYKYDDTRVTALNSSEIWLPGEAYLLCFVRRGWQQPFGPY